VAVADTDCVDRNTETFVLDRGESAVVAALDLDQLSAHVRSGDEIAVLPPEAIRAMRTLLAALATGATVHVIRTDGELTAQQAADLLEVARADVVRLVERGVLRTTPTTSGPHRFSVRDVLDYREQRAARLAAVEQMVEAAEELGETY
jgi:acyl-coenzyme A synthetase/AMP-(fatty) acid ligase